MLKTLLILAPGFEEIEAVAVIDLLRRAEIEVTIAGLTSPIVYSARQMGVAVDGSLGDFSKRVFDAIILPGGEPGTTNLETDKLVSEVVLAHFCKDKLLAAICAAPRVLHGLGILTGCQVTAFPSVQPLLTEAKVQNKPVVVDGHIITGRDAGAAIEFGLAIVAALKDKTSAMELAKRIGC